MPQGLAILDAPDVDSVVEENRELAAQLLAAADLWLFVTSAARYADQVPWEFLRQAAERSTAVAIVLDRTPEEAVQTVATHLARMLASRGLKDSPLFVVHEGPVSDDGLLPADYVAEIRGWLESLAGDVGRPPAAWCIQTLDGAVRTLTRRTYPVADAAAEQVAAAERLREDADGGLRRGGRAPCSPASRTAPCCAARCWPAGRSSSAPASCSRGWRPGSAGSGTGWSTPSRAGRSRPSGSPSRSSPAWRC